MNPLVEKWSALADALRRLEAPDTATLPLREAQAWVAIAFQQCADDLTRSEVAPDSEVAPGPDQDEVEIVAHEPQP